MRSSFKRAFHVAAIAVVAAGGLMTAGTFQPANAALIYDTRFCRNHPRDPHCHPYHRPACGYHHHLNRFGRCVPN